MLGFRYINDKTLVQLIKTGNEEALTILYNLTYAPVKKYILRNKGRLSDVEENMAEALLTSWQHVIRNKTTPDLSLKFYVIAVAQNRWNKRKKKKTKKAGSETPAEQPLIQHSDLVAALKQLTDGERKLLYFFYFDGYSAKEIAALLGLTGPEEMRMEKSRILLKLSELLNVK